MTRKALVERNKKRQDMYLRLHDKRDALKAIIKDLELSIEDRLDAQIKLQAMPRDSSKIRHLNRCINCNRPKGVYQYFGLCRCCLRKFFSKGYIPGLRKSSW